MGKFFTIILLLFCSFALQAQVFSPDVQCVRNDTLYWGNVVNTCGTFNSYDVFFSTDANGPFTLLAEVINENQTNFYHDNTGGIFHYYIAANYDCPGEAVIFSDTLDNLLPPIVVISVASVTGSDVELNWQTSNAPEVIGYIVFRETSIGVIPVDTVFGNNLFYLDENATADTNVESYFILALDACGGTSIFDEEHQTVFLETEAENCDDFIQLNWTPYIGWVNGVETYEIWISTNGSPANLVEEVGGDIGTYNFPAPADFNEYCFYILAKENFGTNIANSNISCETVDIIQPIRDYGIKNISVRADNSVVIDWVWSSTADLIDYSLSRGENIDDLVTILTEDVTTPLIFENTYLDSDIDPKTGSFYYSVETLDGCGTISKSATSSTIFLDGRVLDGNANLITWTPLDIENSVIDFYEIFRIKDGVSNSIGIVEGTENAFLYENIELKIDEPTICYYVVANARVTLFDESEQLILSRSNEVCIQQNSLIFVPNAFTPQGINREFRAVVLYDDMVTFEMEIYDRFGQQIFVSRDVDLGWTGDINGQGASQGVYVYHIRITQENGRMIDKQGNVLLLR
ncbi:MAG: gliding motility-associated-like protein [Saprospiraceae bacterium]|jgi:gliding motility-associated-like protein